MSSCRCKAILTGVEGEPCTLCASRVKKNRSGTTRCATSRLPVVGLLGTNRPGFAERRGEHRVDLNRPARYAATTENRIVSSSSGAYRAVPPTTHPGRSPRFCSGTYLNSAPASDLA